MKIVVLDGFPVNPGDISWDCIKKLGDLTVYDRTPENLVTERAKDAEILLVNKIKLSSDVLEKMPMLKYIGLLSTGTDVVDIDYCDNHNIVVCNIPAYSTGNVAQTVFAYILSKFSPVVKYSAAVHENAWVNSPDFCFQTYPMSDLAGKTIGIIGCGKIGQQVARIAKSFDMKVLFYSRTKKNVRYCNKWCDDLDELLRCSDIVTLHCPLTKDNKLMADKNFLSKMKPEAILINTARGGLINEEDLANALDRGLISGAFLDVLSSEPPKPDNPLLKAKNCVITPHIAWATREARLRLMSICENNIKGFLKGRTQNTVGKIKTE